MPVIRARFDDRPLPPIARKLAVPKQPPVDTGRSTAPNGNHNGLNSTQPSPFWTDAHGTTRHQGRLCPRNRDRLVAFGRAHDRLKHRYAVQDVLGRDRIDLLAADRRSEGFKFGQQRIEALVLDDLGGGRGVAPSARPFGRWREPELELRGPEFRAALGAKHGESGANGG